MLWGQTGLYIHNLHMDTQTIWKAELKSTVTDLFMLARSYELRKGA